MAIRLFLALAILLVLTSKIQALAGDVSENKYAYENIPVRCQGIHPARYDSIGPADDQLVWIPVRRQQLGDWYWLNNHTYGKVQSNIDHMDCALLHVSQHVVDGDVCRKTNKALCSTSRGDSMPCPDINGYCFRLPPYLYLVLSQDLSWYQARHECTQHQMDLAYFYDKQLRTVSSHIQGIDPEIHSVWIGLRKAEFISQKGNGYLQWDTNQPRPCEGCDCAVAVLNDSRLERLQARPCHEENKVICPVYEESTESTNTQSSEASITEGWEMNEKGHRGFTLFHMVLTGLITTVIVSLLHISGFVIWYKYRTKGGKKNKAMVKETDNTEKGEVLIPFIVRDASLHPQCTVYPPQNTVISHDDAEAASPEAAPPQTETENKQAVFYQALSD